MLLWPLKCRSDRKSGYPGALVDRWKNWKRLNPLCLILALALVVCPATRASAAYGSTFSASVSADPAQNGTYVLQEVDADSEVVTVVSYGSIYLQSSWADQQLYSDGYVMQGLLRGYIAVTPPAVSGWAHKSSAVIIDNIFYDTAFQSFGVEPYVYSNGRGFFYGRISQINMRPSFGCNVTYHVVSSYQASGSGGSVGSFTATHPDVAASNLLFTGEYVPITDLLPDLHDLKESLIGANGWMNTINTNLHTSVVQGATQNSYLLQILSSQNSANTKLDNIYTTETNMKLNQELMYNAQMTQVDQLNQILDYVNSTKAASAVDDARQDFIDDAVSMESQQSVLEGAADASVGAVDMNDINIIDNFSQSVSFWGSLVSQLPTVLGSLWSVFIFGLLLAFVLFVLRIRR